MQEADERAPLRGNALTHWALRADLMREMRESGAWNPFPAAVPRNTVPR